MNITLETPKGKYTIKRDNYQFILSELRTVSDEKSKNYGKEVEGAPRFYPHLEQLASVLLHNVMQDSDADTLQDLVSSVNLGVEKIVATIKNVNEE